MGSFLLHHLDSSYAASSSSAYPSYHSVPSLYSQLSQPLLPTPSGLQRWSLAAGDLAPYSFLPTPSLDLRLVAPVYLRPDLVGYPPPAHASRLGGVVNRQSVSQVLGSDKTISKPKQAGKKKSSKVESKESKDKSNALVKEVRELHALWRAGVVEPSFNIAGKKRNASKANEGVEKPSNEDWKKSQRKKRRKLRNRNVELGTKDLGKKKSGPATASTEEMKGFPKPLGIDAWEESSIDPQPTTWGESTQNLTIGAIPLAKKSVISLDLQKEACKSVREFFRSGLDDDDSDNEALSDSDGEAESEGVKGREEKAFDFFSKLFEENEQLRKLYVDECNCGKFECLVCSAIDSGKATKFFESLVSLVMHSSKILKTKKRPEHRAYGRAVCSVLGWDPLRTPILPKGKGIHSRGCIPPNEDAADATTQLDDDHNPEGVIATNVVQDTTA